MELSWQPTTGIENIAVDIVVRLGLARIKPCPVGGVCIEEQFGEEKFKKFPQQEELDKKIYKFFLARDSPIMPK